MHELELEKEAIASSPEKLAIVFKEMIQMCLWYYTAASQMITG
jgi:hypothetical protein